MGVNPKIGGKPPKWMVKIMVPNPMNKRMIWGENPPIFGNIQMKVYRSNVGWIRVKKIEYPGRSPLATTTARPRLVLKG